MLLSFDIDGTLIHQFKHQQPYTVSQTVAFAIAGSLINGDTVLINTANHRLIKTRKIVFDILSLAYMEDSQNRPLFSPEEREKLIGNMNRNLYVSLCVGASLSKIKVGNPNDFARASVCPEDLIQKSIQIEKVFYDYSLTPETVERIKHFITTNPFLSAHINKEHYGSVTPKERIMPFSQTPSASIRPIFFRDLNSKKTPQECAENSSYLKEELKKNGLPVNLEWVSNRAIIFAPLDCVKAKPVEYLGKELNIPVSERVMFGDTLMDVIPAETGRTFLMNNSRISKTMKENLQKDGVRFFDNLTEAIAVTHIEKMSKSKSKTTEFELK